MKFDELVILVGKQPWFDLATLVQLTDERRESLTNQLYRFSKKGKIIPLRRGMYVLADHYRKTPLQAAELAAAIYYPSYLSHTWALSYYGIIPEGAPVFTSVTTRTPKSFQNAFGEFRYRNVKRDLFFGYSPVEMSGRKVLIATPEKALVDYWHLEAGEWDDNRMREMRSARIDILDIKRLETIVEQSEKPRLFRAFKTWERITKAEIDGEIEI